MTDKEKSRAYDEAIKKAKEIKEKIVHSHLSTESCKAVSEYIDTIIPELRESEDKRIREYILRACKETIAADDRGLELSMETTKRLAAYLEKQKEQKSNIEKLKEISTPANENWFEIQKQWEKEDEQKPVEYGDDVVEEAEEYTSKVDCGEYGVAVTEAYIAGVLSERNRKPAEWSEEDIDILRDAICAADILAKDFKKDNPHLAKKLRVAKEWLESLPTRFTFAIKQEWDEFDSRCLERAIWYVENPAPSVVKDTNLALWLQSLPQRLNLQPKQEWSEEDKDYYDTIVRKLEVIGDDSGLSNNQIKFLREHCPSHRLEWSEEDEKDVAHIIRILDDCYAYGRHDLSKTDHENLVNKLKSLRPSWKPSEEQIRALEKAILLLEHIQSMRYQS